MTVRRSALVATRLLAVVALLLLATFHYGEPIWLVNRDVRIVGFGFAATLLLCMGAYALLRTRRQGPVRLLARHVVVTGAVVVPLIVAFFLAGLRISRLELLFETSVFFGVLAINYSWMPDAVAIMGNVALIAVAAALNLSPASISSFKEVVLGTRSVKFDDTAQFVFSSRHDLKVTTKFLPLKSEGLGGAIELIDDDRLLVATGDGEVVVVPLNETKDDVTRTPIKIPVNREEYDHGVAHTFQWFRVTDIYLERSSQPKRRLFAAHHHWDKENRCITTRLSETEVDVQRLESEPAKWRTVYESSPCLSDKDVSNLSGGRIAFLPPSTLLLTIGSNNYDADVKLSDYDASSYGKIMAIDIESGHSEVYSQGHRNAQGLLVAGDVVWETEQGPEGGDELNVIERGADYGWPRSTYGTEYGFKNWPGIVGPLEHSYGHEPVYAWVPSVGISNLIQVRGSLFTAWKGDLLIGSLEGLGTGRSLLRVKIREGPRAVLVEKIATGRPVRDLLEDPRGRLVMWDGVSALQFVEPGRHVFSTCSGCHPLLWQTRGIGPDLMGIVGDRVARQSDYPYSAAMREFGGRWTTDRLDAFLRNPAEVVPGTLMHFPGVEDADQRAEIIQYLAQLHMPRDVQAQAPTARPVSWWDRLLRPLGLAH